MSNCGYSACRSDNQLHWPTQWCLEVMCDYMLSWELETEVVCSTFFNNTHRELYCLLYGFKRTPDVCIFVLGQLFSFKEHHYQLVSPDGALESHQIRILGHFTHVHKQHLNGSYA